MRIRLRIRRTGIGKYNSTLLQINIRRHGKSIFSRFETFPFRRKIPDRTVNGEDFCYILSSLETEGYRKSDEGNNGNLNRRKFSDTRFPSGFFTGESARPFRQSACSGKITESMSSGKY